jgi:hypothetical protein
MRDLDAREPDLCAAGVAADVNVRWLASVACEESELVAAQAEKEGHPEADRQGLASGRLILDS